MNNNGRIYPQNYFYKQLQILADNIKKKKIIKDREEKLKRILDK